jgi:hypothetical protein
MKAWICRTTTFAVLGRRAQPSVPCTLPSSKYEHCGSMVSERSLLLGYRCRKVMFVSRSCNRSEPRLLAAARTMDASTRNRVLKCGDSCPGSQDLKQRQQLRRTAALNRCSCQMINVEKPEGIPDNEHGLLTNPGCGK